MRRFIVIWSLMFVGAVVVLIGQGGHAAETECKLYKVTAPILDVRKDAEKQGGYIDVLENGDIACVTRTQKIGSRMWGFVAHKVQKDGAPKPIKGWVGLRYMKLQAKAAAPKADAKPAAPAPQSESLTFDRPVPFGPYPVRGKTLKELAAWQPIFSPIEGLDENLWKKPCTTCHKWNQARLCKQGSSYIKSAKAVFRHQHPYGGPYKLALMRWAKAGCK